MSSTGENKADLTQDEVRILSTLAEKGLRTTRPVQSGGALFYDGLEELTKELSGNKISQLLKSLLDKGYLKESSNQSILVCPKCESSNVTTTYVCPYCQSKKVRKSKLAEHKLCGYIGNLDEFDQVDSYLCPKCKTQITRISSDPKTKQGGQAEVLRVIGSSYVCDKCGAKFEKPNVLHTCVNCNKDFTYKEANYVQIPTYEVVKKLEPTKMHSVSDNVEEKKAATQTTRAIHVQEPVKTPATSVSDVIKQIEPVFKENGFTIEIGFKLPGKSGFKQSFDAGAKKEEFLVLIDVSQTGDQADLIGLVGKKKDVNSEAVVLIDTTGNPKLIPLGKQYNITVLSSKEEGYLEKLSNLLDAGNNVQVKKPFSWRGKQRNKQLD